MQLYKQTIPTFYYDTELVQHQTKYTWHTEGSRQSTFINLVQNIQYYKC